MDGVFKIANLKHHNDDIGLIGHIIVDYPTPTLARQAVDIMVKNGVEIIELQIPFSEPVADGPVFMAANHEALDAGVCLEDAFNLMKEVTTKYPDTHFVFMSYGNILFKYGFEGFVAHAKECGALGAIVPDLPIENAKAYLDACQKYDFAAVQLVPPNISDKRLKLVLDNCQGFVYAVARAGVTGAETTFDKQLSDFLARIRKHTTLPIAVGFGVKTAKDIEFLRPHADYAIVGTKAMLVLKEQGPTALNDFWGRTATKQLY